MKIYFIGICGTAMGNVAVLMKRAGHQVAGSDKGIYPPMSQVLVEAGIEMFQGWNEDQLQTYNPDLVVVGNAVTRGNPEVELLLRSKAFSFCSLPDLIGNQLLKDRKRVVITGTHGKTTTTALTAWLLKQAGLEPGWLIGGVPRALSSGSELGSETAPFVLEGDEYDSAFFDKRSKFIHYRPDVLVINNVEFDHADIFRDITDVKRTFNHLIRIIPDDGVVLANGDDPVIRELLPVTWTRVYFVGTGNDNDFVLTEFAESRSGSRFILRGSDGNVWRFETCLNGIYNARNVCMALLSSAYTINPDFPDVFLNQASLDGYEGVVRRQDVLHATEDLRIIEDFAHHPTAIALCLESIRNCYPDWEITVVFEPRSNTSATKVLQSEFTAALGNADRVLISPVHRGEIYSDDVRIDPRIMVADLMYSSCTANSFDSNEDLFEFLANLDDSKKRVIVLCTNGSFGEPLQEYLRRVKSEE